VASFVVDKLLDSPKHRDEMTKFASENERLMWFLLDASANPSNQVATVMSLAGD
jgi:hypothetical protein